MDAEEIARLVQDLRVSSAIGDKAVTITGDEAVEGRKRLENVVVGKIFSRRSITREMLRSNLPRILRIRGSAEIELVGNNLYVISFSLMSDKRVALEEGPWHFFQDLMILKQSKPMQTPMEVEFEEFSLWVQCHNVPVECMEPVIIERIGTQIGKVKEVDVGEGGSCVGKFARVRITRPINAPLVKCVPLKQEGSDKEVIVILQYERLPDFCFCCGRVGHISRDCTDIARAKQNPSFGGWLRAGRTFTGRREVGEGIRSGAKSSWSGSSESRKVVVQPLLEVEDGVKSNDGAGSGASNHGMGKGMVEATRAEVEAKSVAESHEEDMHIDKGMALVARGDEVAVGSEGGRGFEEAGGEIGPKRRGKGKSPVKANLRLSKSSGRSWKRLARERKVGSGGGIMSDGADRKRGGSLKRSSGLLRDEVGEEEEEADMRVKPKYARLMEAALEENSTAEAASQPRREL